LTKKHQDKSSPAGLFHQEINWIKTEISKISRNGRFVKKEEINALKTTQAKLKEVQEIVASKPSFQSPTENKINNTQASVALPSQEDQNLLAELQEKLKKAKETLSMLKGQRSNPEKTQQKKHKTL